MQQVVLFILTYIMVFLVYKFLITRKVKTKNKKKDNKPIEVRLLEYKYNIDIEKLDYSKLLRTICIVSSLDITIIITLILLFKSFLLQVLISLVLAFPIILASYSFIGKYYVKKGMIKDE